MTVTKNLKFFDLFNYPGNPLQASLPAKKNRYYNSPGIIKLPETRHRQHFQGYAA